MRKGCGGNVAALLCRLDFRSRQGRPKKRRLCTSDVQGFEACCAPDSAIAETRLQLGNQELFQRWRFKGSGYFNNLDKRRGGIPCHWVVPEPREPAPDALCVRCFTDIKQLTICRIQRVASRLVADLRAFPRAQRMNIMYDKSRAVWMALLNAITFNMA